jgi:rhamnose transport system substrate-binding protein
MIRRPLLIAALGASLAALNGAVPAEPSRAAQRNYTIAYLTYVKYASGGREAAGRLGVRILAPSCVALCSPADVVRRYTSMIARHVDAIVSDGYDPSLTPTLKKVRNAGILLVAAGDDIAGGRDLWVGPADPVSYGQALADTLASQMGNQGEYAILDERGEFPVAKTWKKAVEGYIRKAYPKMKLDGALTETGAGDAAEIDSVKSYLAAHPKLKGLISVVPTETYMAAEAITQAGRIGQVFSAGNGGSSLADPELRNYVRSGAAELVFAANPIKLGYLTAWATHYLLTGHHFRPGAYQVGGPIGLVYYYAKHQELRLGHPLTITKTNLRAYANKF